MGSASIGRRLRCGRPARAPFSSPTSARVIAARRLLPTEAEIYVLNGLEASADPADYVEHRLKPAIGSAEELERWSAFATRKGRLQPSALHLDTGMRRLGFDFAQSPERGDGARRRGERRRSADEPFRLVRNFQTIR